MESSMGSQSLTAVDNLHLRPNDPPTADKSTLRRYQLNVIAADVADVVQSVGGWLFDRSMAGWDVIVFLADHNDDVRPLRIVGVRTAELQPAPLPVNDGAARAAALAIASDLLGTDESIDAEVGDALRCGDIELALWGNGGFPGRVDPLQYRLSAAARLFKAHALAAAGLTDVPVGISETLFRCGPTWAPASAAQDLCAEL
jgi:hypothetical protein